MKESNWWKNIVTNIFWFLFPVFIVAFLKFALTEPSKRKNVEDYIVPGISGGLVGYLIKIIANYEKKLSKFDENFILTVNKAFFQDKAIELLTQSGKHYGVIKELLNASIQDQCKKIADVDEFKYISYLIQAISKSERYKGVQRNSVRWFLENNKNTNYLKTLRDKRMQRKVRIFLTSKNTTKEMEEDINDDELMKQYWETTGRNLETYWITEENFKNILDSVVKLE